MLFREIITVSFQHGTKLINTLCGQNSELLNVKAGAIDQINYQYPLQGYCCSSISCLFNNAF
jgi:hypothetical protein